jgi:hypothetical protein
MLIRVPNGLQEMMLGHALRVHQSTEIVVCACIARPQSERLFIVADCVVRVGRVTHKVAKVVVQLGVVGQHLQTRSGNDRGAQFYKGFLMFKHPTKLSKLSLDCQSSFLSTVLQPPAITKMARHTNIHLRQRRR